MGESAYKPGSVEDSHSSGMRVTTHLKRPTRTRRGSRQSVPIWSCSGWGLPCRGMLPSARCALTTPFHPCLYPQAIGGLFSVALSIGSRRPGVTWHPTLRSPDFPPRLKRSDCPADSHFYFIMNGLCGFRALVGVVAPHGINAAEALR